MPRGPESLCLGLPSFELGVVKCVGTGPLPDHAKIRVPDIMKVR